MKNQKRIAMIVTLVMMGSIMSSTHAETQSHISLSDNIETIQGDYADFDHMKIAWEAPEYMAIDVGHSNREDWEKKRQLPYEKFDLDIDPQAKSAILGVDIAF